MSLIDDIKQGGLPNTLSKAQAMIQRRDAALLAAEELAEALEACGNIVTWTGEVERVEAALSAYRKATEGEG